MCKTSKLNSLLLGVAFAVAGSGAARAQTPNCNVPCPGPNLASNVAGGGDTIAYPKGGDYLTQGRTVGDGGTVFADCEDVVFVSRAIYTAGSYAYYVQTASFSVDGVVQPGVVLNTSPNFVLAPLGQCDAGSGSGPLQEFAPVFIPSPSPSVGSPIITTYEVRFNGRILSGACGSAGAFVTRELHFVTCDDGNECTIDSCVPSVGCSNVPRVCEDDGNPCTATTCDPAVGCINTEVNCDDSNACTLDRCVETPVPDSPNGATTVTCEYTPVVCADDGNPCTANRCDPMLGCVYDVVNCNDGNACTLDRCVETPVPDSPNGATTVTCEYTNVVCDDDANPCTANRCDPILGCVYDVVNCDDGNACTTDRCVETPVAGSANGATSVTCEYTNVTCADDNNPCTANRCDPMLGCVYDVVNCDDGNACTNDRCVETPVPDSQNGATSVTCERTDVVCADDNNPCTANRCDPTLGCVYDVVNCDDGNACTNDRCVETPVAGSVNGATTVTCERTNVVCDDGNRCTDDTCNPMDTDGDPCVHTPNQNCNNGCTPGFWKNCTQQWAGTGYAYPGPALNTIFTFPASLSSLGTKTLADALGFQGGSTLEGGAQILLRAAAAALLNAGKGIGYPMTQAEIIAAVNTALAGTRADMITLAGTLDGYNNLGCRDSSGNGLPCKLK